MIEIIKVKKILVIIILVCLIFNAKPGLAQVSADELSAKKFEIVALLKAKKYQAVQSALDELIIERPISMNGRRVLEEIYFDLFQRIRVSDYAEEWVAQYPNHHGAHIFLGEKYLRDAWRERGTGWAYTVSDERFRNFYLFSKNAAWEFYKAYQLQPRDPYSSTQMMTVLGAAGGKLDQWFQKARTADAFFYAAYGTRMFYLFPKWDSNTLTEAIQKWGGPKWRDIFQKWGGNKLDRLLQGLGERWWRPVWFTIFWSLITPKEVSVGLAFRLAQELIGFSDLKQHPIVSYFVWSGARSAYDQWIAKYPESALARSWFAYLLIESHNYDQALPALKKAVQLDPSNLDALTDLGNTYFHLEKYEDAEKTYRSILEQAPEVKDALHYLGDIYGDYYKDIPKALEFYDKAILLYPNEAVFYFHRGTLYIEQKKYPEAIADLSHAVDINPRSEHYRLWRGKAYWLQGQYVEAENDFGEAMQMADWIQEQVKQFKSENPEA